MARIEGGCHGMWPHQTYCVNMLILSLFSQASAIAPTWHDQSCAQLDEVSHSRPAAQHALDEGCSLAANASWGAYPVNFLPDHCPQANKMKASCIPGTTVLQSHALMQQYSCMRHGFQGNHLCSSTLAKPCTTVLYQDEACVCTR